MALSIFGFSMYAYCTRVAVPARNFDICTAEFLTTQVAAKSREVDHELNLPSRPVALARPR